MVSSTTPSSRLKSDLAGFVADGSVRNLLDHVGGNPCGRRAVGHSALDLFVRAVALQCGAEMACSVDSNAGQLRRGVEYLRELRSGAFELSCVCHALMLLAGRDGDRDRVAREIAPRPAPDRPTPPTRPANRHPFEPFRLASLAQRPGDRRLAQQQKPPLTREKQTPAM